MIKNDPSLEKCRQVIEASLHWGDAANWTNEDFDHLSERIFDKTAVRLSVSTLKRIWGKVRYESSPTAATLNALARYAGYSGWREFQQQQESAAGEQLSPAAADELPSASAYAKQLSVTAAGSTSSVAQPSLPTADPRPSTPPRRRWLMTFIIVPTVVILIALIFLFAARLRSGVLSQKPEESDKVTFGTKKTSEDLPNSVVFYYDATSLDPQRVILQQSWDTARRELIPAGGKEVTSIYYYPGYFMAKLIVDGTVRKQSPVFIKTKGWKGIIEGRPLPIYLSAAETGMAAPDSGLGISSDVLQKKTGSPLFNNTWVDFTNVREFENIPAGHFTLSTTLRNTSTVEQCLCRKIKITVLGTEGAIIIPLADKGCISDLSMLTGEQMINGKDKDLSAFGCDFSGFQHLACTVEDHRLKIILNNTLIFDTEQRQTIGEIVGIRIAFEGAGQIKDLSLKGPGQELTLIPAQSR